MREQNDQDVAKEIESCGGWVIGANGRKAQEADLNTIRRLVMPYSNDPVIAYHLKKFINRVPGTTNRSTGRELNSSYARMHLSDLVKEIASGRWKTESREARLQERDELFWSE